MLQLSLAVLFLLHGWHYVSWTLDTPLPPDRSRVDSGKGNLPFWFRLSVGVLEILSATALVLPGLTNTLPWLTPLAATGLMMITVSAVLYHLIRGEAVRAFLSAILFLLLTFLAVMRWLVLPL